MIRTDDHVTVITKGIICVALVHVKPTICVFTHGYLSDVIYGDNLSCAEV